MKLAIADPNSGVKSFVSRHLGNKEAACLAGEQDDTELLSDSSDDDVEMPQHQHNMLAPGTLSKLGEVYASIGCEAYHDHIHHPYFPIWLCHEAWWHL